MLDYNRAKQYYDKGRKSVHLGVSLGLDFWLNYDAENDIYTVSMVMSKYYTIPDPTAPGTNDVMWVRATAKERDKYTMGAMAKIDKTCAILMIPENYRTGDVKLRNFFLRYYSVYPTPGRSITRKEVLWFRQLDGRTSPPVPSGARAKITFNKVDGALTGIDPVLHRVFDKANQKALNAQIVEARKLISLREKLGTFAGIDLAEHAELVGRRLKPGTGSKYNLLNKDVAVKLIQAIDATNFDSILDVLAAAEMNRPWHLRSQVKKHELGHYLRIFNNLIDSNREGLRKAQNVVSYQVL